MKAFTSRATIRASAETVWNILTDGPAYPQWNTAVTALDGRVAPGELITLHVRSAPGRAFPVRVSTFEAPRIMTWRGGMPLGLFVGERVFEIHDRGDRVDFLMVEWYLGPLAPLMERAIPDLQPSFDEFTACLRAHAEAMTATATV